MLPEKEENAFVDRQATSVLRFSLQGRGLK
jgi:hypothetical protein